MRVGILIVASLVVLILLLLNASGDFSPFARKLQLKANFATADGLRPGSEVRLAGVRVGSVKDVKILLPSDDPNANKVQATFEINNVIDGQPATERIRADSSAQLTSPSILGTDKLINIIPGSSLAPPVQENAVLNSSAARGFGDLANTGNDLAQRLTALSEQFTDITRKINEGQGTLGRFVNDEAFYNNLNATIRETQDTIRQIRTGQGTAGRLLNDPALYENVNRTVTQLEAISKDLRAGRGTAGKLLTDDAIYTEARQSISKLNKSIDDINLIIADVRAGRGSVGKLLTDEAIYNDARLAIARVNTATERIDSVVAGAQRGEGTVGKLLTDDQLYSNINQLSGEGVKLIYDFRQNPKKYLTIKLELF